MVIDGVVLGDGDLLGVVVECEVLPAVGVVPREIEVQGKVQVSHHLNITKAREATI